MMTTESRSVVGDSERVIVGWIELRKGFHSYLTSAGCLLVFREGVLRHIDEKPRESARTETRRKKKKGDHRAVKKEEPVLVSDTGVPAEETDELLIPDLEGLFNSSPVDNVASTPVSGETDLSTTSPASGQQQTKGVNSIDSMKLQPDDINKNSYELPLADPCTKYFTLPIAMSRPTVHTVQLSGWTITVVMSSSPFTAATALETLSGSSSSSQDLKTDGHSYAGISIDNKSITLSSSSFSPPPPLLSSPKSILTGRFTYTITLEDITAYSSMKLMIYYEVKSYLNDCQTLRMNSTRIRSNTHLSAYSNNIDASGHFEEEEEEEVLSVPALSAVDTRLRQSLPLLVPVVRHCRSANVSHEKTSSTSPVVISLTYEYCSPNVSS